MVGRRLPASPFCRSIFRLARLWRHAILASTRFLGGEADQGGTPPPTSRSPNQRAWREVMGRSGTSVCPLSFRSPVPIGKVKRSSVLPCRFQLAASMSFSRSTPIDRTQAASRRQIQKTGEPSRLNGRRSGGFGPRHQPVSMRRPEELRITCRATRPTNARVPPTRLPSQRPRAGPRKPATALAVLLRRLAVRTSAARHSVGESATVPRRN